MEAQLSALEEGSTARAFRLQEPVVINSFKTGISASGIAYAPKPSNPINTTCFTFFTCASRCALNPAKIKTDKIILFIFLNVYTPVVVLITIQVYKNRAVIKTNCYYNII